MLTNEHSGWRMMKDQLYRARVNSKHHDMSVNLRNTTTTNVSREKNDEFERLDQIRDLCHQFAWNVLNNDSHLFVFSTYILSNEMVCSLSDVDLNSTYPYACQYGSYCSLVLKRNSKELLLKFSAGLLFRQCYVRKTW